MSSKQQKSAREAKLAQARKQAKASERKRAVLLAGASGLVILFIAGAVGWAILSEREERAVPSNRVCR